MTTQPALPGPAPHPAVALANAVDVLMAAGFEPPSDLLDPWGWMSPAIADLVRQRDQARDIAVALEQEVADYKAGWDVWRDRIAAIRDLTFMSDDGRAWVHTEHPEDEGEPECPACWSTSIRRALGELS